jgi:hypothetical protein
MMTMLDLFSPCYPSIFCLSLFFIFCVLALLALFFSSVLSSVCNVAMVPVGVISIWNDEKRRSGSFRRGPVSCGVFQSDSEKLVSVCIRLDSSSANPDHEKTRQKHVQVAYRQTHTVMYTIHHLCTVATRRLLSRLVFEGFLLRI